MYHSKCIHWHYYLSPSTRTEYVSSNCAQYLHLFWILFFDTAIHCAMVVMRDIFFHTFIPHLFNKWLCQWIQRWAKAQTESSRKSHCSKRSWRLNYEVMAVRRVFTGVMESWSWKLTPELGNWRFLEQETSEQILLFTWQNEVGARKTAGRSQTHRWNQAMCGELLLEDEQRCARLAKADVRLGRWLEAQRCEAL